MLFRFKPGDWYLLLRPTELASVDAEIEWTAGGGFLLNLAPHRACLGGRRDWEKNAGGIMSPDA